MSRRDEVASGLARVRERIERSARASGRDPEEVTLVVVTKFFPADDVRLLADLGVTDVAENRHQEAVDKAAECHDLGLRWHFVGGLQSNKAAALVSYATALHSLDRPKLVPRLVRGAEERPAELGDLDVLVQVSLDPPDAGEGRQGVDPDAVEDLAEQVAAAPGLALRGVMGVAPREGDPARAFAVLADVAASVRRRHPDAGWISAGMSGDLEEAVAAGATHCRVGSAVLGTRPSNR